MAFNVKPSRQDLLSLKNEKKTKKKKTSKFREFMSPTFQKSHKNDQVSKVATIYTNDSVTV